MIPDLIWVTEDACWLLASEIRSISCVNSFAPFTAFTREFAVSLTIVVPFSIDWIECAISKAVFFDASALLLARLRTSSATTAKPFPAFPALAASTAALNASIFVWNAISSIVLIILLISFESFTDFVHSFNNILHFLIAEYHLAADFTSLLICFDCGIGILIYMFGNGSNS